MMLFKTKAETLEALSGVIKTGKILNQFRFTTSRWSSEPQKVLEDFLKKHPKWSHEPLIVRSSGIAEDSKTESLAGHFETVSNVIGEKALIAAIHTVQKSFPEKSSDDQIFLQPMLKDISISGVAFTTDPNNAGFYYIINYDDHSGDTDTVTSGASNDLKTVYHAKGAKKPNCKWISRLLIMLEELESLFENNALDVEFAVDKKENIILLQVRPLVIQYKNPMTIEEHKKNLEEIKTRYSALSAPHPYLLGKNAIFGIMPDWNPAEIIGTRPRPLAFSLYKELITDGTWAYQRDNYGYRNLRSFPLLVNFSGLPYIDVRISFNSFIPADLKDNLAEKLVNHYLERLIEYPNKHDKVEFDIIYSCYTLDLPERISELKKEGFSQDECDDISDSLRRLTNGIIHSEDGLWKKDISKLDELKSRQKTISSSNLTQIEKIYWLLEDCKRHGTLPFAGLARAGFIAVQLLHSLVRVGILTEIEHERFMASLESVSSNMKNDLRQSKSDFLKKYGHLRPGTYDILSNRYDESPELYFDWNNLDSNKESNKEIPFTLSLDTMNRLEKLLKEHRLEHNVLSLFDFIKRAIEGREYAKFVFTKSLSDALVLIKNVGQVNGISVEDLSYSDISFVKKLYSSSDNIKNTILHSIKDGKQKYLKSCSLTLPPLLTNISNIFTFELPTSEPNYITLQSIRAKVISDTKSQNDLKGNILLIQSADPGYDWIFSHNIGGFITMYGGVNSHMAIRAAELKIPAVIGVGEVLYQQWVNKLIIEIDCANKQVHIIK